MVQPDRKFRAQAAAEQPAPRDGEKRERALTEESRRCGREGVREKKTTSYILLLLLLVWGGVSIAPPKTAGKATFVATPLFFFWSRKPEGHESAPWFVSRKSASWRTFSRTERRRRLATDRRGLITEDVRQHRQTSDWAASARVLLQRTWAFSPNISPKGRCRQFQVRVLRCFSFAVPSVSYLSPKTLGCTSRREPAVGWYRHLLFFSISCVVP